MREGVAIAVLTAVLNGAVTWGVVSTKLDWLRRDVDKLETRVASVEARPTLTQK